MAAARLADRTARDGLRRPRRDARRQDPRNESPDETREAAEQVQMLGERIKIQSRTTQGTSGRHGTLDRDTDADGTGTADALGFPTPSKS